MIQLVISMIRWAIGWMCDFPWYTKILMVLILPAIPGAIGPLNHFIFWLLIFLPIYFTENSLNVDDSRTKSFGIAFRNAYLIYHALFVVIYGVAIFALCKANEFIDSTPLGMVV